MSGAARVLVVDDDEGIREVIHAVLSDEGYEVATAEDGLSALEVAAGWPPDLIVLDLRMPRMDGWAFVRSYRDTPSPHAPILVLTAGRDAASSAAGLAAAAALDKPFDLDDFLAAVRRLAGESGRRQAPPALSP